MFLGEDAFFYEDPIFDEETIKYHRTNSQMIDPIQIDQDEFAMPLPKKFSAPISQARKVEQNETYSHMNPAPFPPPKLEQDRLSTFEFPK